MPNSASVARRFAGPSDLHLHSACSDGTQSPAGLVRDVHAHGLRTMAITDHDTVAGWAAAGRETRSLGMTLIPGMELSTRVQWRSIHLLAYLFDPSHDELAHEMQLIREDRLGRAERITRSIAADYPLTWEDVLAQREEGASLGRPHIADALVARGIVANRDAAFAGILHPRAGYTEPLYAPDLPDAIRMVVAAGGVPIMAHPAPTGRARMLPIAQLEELVDAGLAGFEIEHRENDEDAKPVLLDLVARRGLIATGSSDAHGAGKPNVPGENTTSTANVQAIIDRASGTEPVYPE